MAHVFQAPFKKVLVMRQLYLPLGGNQKTPVDEDFFLRGSDELSCPEECDARIQRTEEN
jgi:hypothetical protein